MIKQHIYRRSASGYRTVAASAGGAWLALAEQQTGLHYQSEPAAPTYFQYSAGRALVLSRCAADPNGSRGAYLAHQLFIEDEADARALFEGRPLSRTLFRDAYVERGEEIEPLPTMRPPEPDDDELSACFRTLDAMFKGDARLLARYICALRTVAGDRERLLLNEMDERPALLSERARQLMELITRALPFDTARSLSYCTYIEKPGYALSYAVSFTGRVAQLSGGLKQLAIRMRFSERELTCPPGLTLAPTDADNELAEALIAHDTYWAERARPDGARVRTVRPPKAESAPPFESDMSLKQYVSDWLDDLRSQERSLNARGLSIYARHMWPSVADQLIEASRMMGDGLRFISEMGAAVALLRREGRALGVDGGMLEEAATVLLDSVDWQEIDLCDEWQRSLIAAATAYAGLLRQGDPLREAALVVNCAIRHDERSFARGMQSVRLACEKSGGYLARAQECLGRYVRGLCGDQRKHTPPGEAFPEAVALSCARYVGGVPDFRGCAAFQTFVAEKFGQKEARAFDRRLSQAKRALPGMRVGARAMSKESRILFWLTLGLLVCLAVFLAYYFWWHR